MAVGFAAFDLVLDCWRDYRRTKRSGKPFTAVRAGKIADDRRIEKEWPRIRVSHLFVKVPRGVDFLGQLIIRSRAIERVEAGLL